MKIRIPPYHLRHNKAVDRFLLVDILRCLPPKVMAKYLYVGLGGPFLEDFKLLDTFFPELRKLSFETDADTYLRQQFNKPNRLIRLENIDMASGLSAHKDIDEPVVVWLDSTGTSLDVFEDFIEILQSVADCSIVRVTMRLGYKERGPDLKLIETLRNELKVRIGQVNCAQQEKHLLQEDVSRIVRERISEATCQTGDFLEISRYLPMDYKERIATTNGLVCVLHEAIHQAAIEALPVNGGRKFRLLSASWYSDGVRMLSVTGAVLSVTAEKEFMEYFKGTDFYDAKWSSSPKQIDLPILTPKERLHLNAIIPVVDNAGKILQKHLGYKIEPKEEESEKEMEMYNQFHRYYPMFAKVAL